MNMITTNNIKELRNIVSNLSYEDWITAYRKSSRYLKGVYTPSGRERKFKGYTLSDKTMEAYNILNLTSRENTTTEEENIKGYLLRIKLLNPELTVKNYMIEKYKKEC